MPADDPAFTDASLALLAELEQNNNRDWYNAHKARFETELFAPFAAVLEEASERLRAAGSRLSGSRDTMFRMNRDVRFSKNKSPYKTAVSGLLTPSGRRGEDDGLAYLHLDATGGFAAVGFYNLTPAALAPIRDAMIEQAEGFAAVLERLTAADRTLWDDNPLSAMPRGYSEHADHPHAEHLKRRSLLIRADLPRERWLDGSITDRLVALARDGTGLLDFCRAARA